MGQLLRRRHVDGVVTEYHYYPIDDPMGTRGRNTAINDPEKICGYLARLVRDANGQKIKNEYAYDAFGNVITIWDGKSNPARVQYNAMGRIENIMGREPFKHSINYKYDANYNEIESSQSFERLEYDERSQTTNIKTDILRELKEYNALDNITQRRLVGGDRVVTESFIRDADERIIRQLQPMGNATEYVYDERNLLIERKFGVGTREAYYDHFTYTRNGAVRSYTDGNNNVTRHHYDGFHRYKGFTNPVGTTKTQSFDETGNVVKVAVVEENRERGPLMEAMYHFDQWNRVYRVDQVWHDPSSGKPLGQSKWNGEKGMCSTLLEYSENGLPGKVWTEADNVLAVGYDGVGRIIKIKDLMEEEV